MKRSRRNLPRPVNASDVAIESLENRELLSAGGLDPTFNFGWGKVATDFGGSSETIRDMAFQADGRIVAVGSTTAGGSNSNFAVARYLPDGTLDGSFGGMGGIGAGRVATDFAQGFDTAEKVLIQNDGKILVVGRTWDGNSGQHWAMARYNADGSMDNTFGVLGKVIVEPFENHYYMEAFMQGNHVVLFGFNGNAAGAAGSSVGMARFSLIDGSPDLSFGVAGHKILEPAIDVHSIAPYEDGFVLSGSRDADMAFTRIDVDGDLDLSFGTDGVAIVTSHWDHMVSTAVVVQSNGAIIGAGTTYNNGGVGEPGYVIVRLLLNGALDASFNVDGVYEQSIPGDASGNLADVVLGPNGTIIAAGGWTAQAGVGQNYNFAVIRLGGDGAPDLNFGDEGFVTIDFAHGNDIATSLLSYANGKILVGGLINNGANLDFGLTRIDGQSHVIGPVRPFRGITTGGSSNPWRRLSPEFLNRLAGRVTYENGTRVAASLPVRRSDQKQVARGDAAHNRVVQNKGESAASGRLEQLLDQIFSGLRDDDETSTNRHSWPWQVSI